MGPLWLDIKTYELDSEEKEMLAHPAIGGVILFSRNYHDPRQLEALNDSLRQAAGAPVLIGVDQEGGRVQRFKDGFTRLPAASQYATQKNGTELAALGGWLMAAELIATGVDLSFAPVLDVGFGCQAIHDRAFGEDIETVQRFSRAFLQGMKSSGMATTGKHFPGHGHVLADSHLETPYDERKTVISEDMSVFRSHIEENLLDAVMPAHVVYPHYDDKPASGSPFWLKEVLRQKLGFHGIIFSDDLSMSGASVMGDIVSRANQALDAGCDMLLVCNDRAATVRLLDNLVVSGIPQAACLQRKRPLSRKALVNMPEWRKAREAIRPLCDIE
ncbi:Beta-hexosaminidase [Vibrio aerogenes CECT 7868]|uniref:Beta-hexosaminidase n=1 Tax=Vibrio aerogenes CECT 7868 TaxID=1216006 RepID=A0A1M5Y7B0_9VIBR|nr:beta-N-acetylhexosaminidase [Vibrio aerogenes]SHI07985.1 Beta-hexosaminidase [Vibrio aerogenes CECT 7868]